MRVLIATPLYPPDIGGPATYTVGLENSLRALGHLPTVICYREVMSLPRGLRQIIFFYKILKLARCHDAIIALDTLSIGLPAMLIARMYRIPGIVRVAGDQIWERYANRTAPIAFPEFYSSDIQLDLTERMMHAMTSLTFKLASKLVFSTEWQKKYRTVGYPDMQNKTILIKNAYTHDYNAVEVEPKEKIFLWAGRDIPLKNVSLLKEAFKDAKKGTANITLLLLTGVSHAEVMKRMKESYAVILPSYSDDSPNILLEGLSYGKPFISTKYNGLLDDIGAMGIAVEPRSKEDISRAIISMSQKGIYQKFQENIRNFKYSHSYEDIAKEFVQLIMPK